jgi:hypothetical protein
VLGRDEETSLFDTVYCPQLESKNRDFGGASSFTAQEYLPYLPEVGLWAQSNQKLFDVVVGCRIRHKCGLANVSLALCTKRDYLIPFYYSRGTRPAANTSRHYPEDGWRQRQGERK